MADVRLVDLEVLKRFSLVLRREFADAGPVGAVHGEVFGTVRPASTMLAVSALLDPRWKVEIEAEALIATA